MYVCLFIYINKYNYIDINKYIYTHIYIYKLKIDE